MIPSKSRCKKVAGNTLHNYIFPVWFLYNHFHYVYVSVCACVYVCAHSHTSKLAATGKLWVRKKCPPLLLPTFRNQINVNIFWKLPLQYIFEKNKPELFSHHAFSALSWPASLHYLWHLVTGEERHSTSCYIVPLIMRDGDYSATFYQNSWVARPTVKYREPSVTNTWELP